MKKMIFCDMDGTIINHEGMLYNQKDKEMLKELQRKGCYVAYNTGRNLQEAMFSIEKLDLPYDYLILNNGGHIVDKNGNDVFKKTISKNVGGDIIEYCMKLGVEVFFYAGDRTIGLVSGKTYEHTSVGFVQVNDIDFKTAYLEVKEYDIIAINQYDLDISKLLKVKEYVEKNHTNSATPTINTTYLDICPSDCSKGTGVQFFKDLKNIVAYSVGDSYNDISMFESSDFSFSFPRATKDVQMHANETVNYVYEVCNKILQ